MMNHQINIGFETEVADENSVRELIRTCAERVLASEQVDFDAEIDVTVVDADAIREMNAEYRNKDAVTDVLLVPDVRVPQRRAAGGAGGRTGLGCVMLGDMIRVLHARLRAGGAVRALACKRVRLPDHAFRSASARLRPRAQ